MIVDVHGHMSAPERLYAYKANLLAHRGSHGRGGVRVTDDELRAAVTEEVGSFGIPHLEHLDTAGTDLQLISPRPYQMMTASSPARAVVRRGDQQHHREAGASSTPTRSAACADCR